MYTRFISIFPYCIVLYCIASQRPRILHILLKNQYDTLISLHYSCPVTDHEILISTFPSYSSKIDLHYAGEIQRICMIFTNKVPRSISHSFKVTKARRWYIYQYNRNWRVKISDESDDIWSRTENVSGYIDETWSNVSFATTLLYSSFL